MNIPDTFGPLQIDPRFERLPAHGKPIMEVYDMPLRTYPPKRRGFFSQCWHAWNPKQRGYRDRKLMPHPTPIVNLLWRVHAWVVMNKAEREAWIAKPWLDFSRDHAMMAREDFEKTWAPHFEEMGL